MEEQKELQVGDIIKRFEVSQGEIDFEYIISSVTKRLAKTKEGNTFYRSLDYYTTKPMENYIAEVRRKEITSLGKRYFLINT